MIYWMYPKTSSRGAIFYCDFDSSEKETQLSCEKPMLVIVLYGL